ncbi:MAG: 4-alpha-glucanotransferase [Magnetospiraceae bacterium]
MAKGDLNTLAQLVGLEPSYWDIFGGFHETAPDVQKAILSAMGFSIDSAVDVADTCQRLEEQTWRNILEPVVVLRQGSSTPWGVLVALPEAFNSRVCKWHLTLENGYPQSGDFRPHDLVAEEVRRIDDGLVYKRRLSLPTSLGPGHHRLTVEGPGFSDKTTVIVAPPHCFDGFHGGKGHRQWGLAGHVYALRRGNDLGMGDFSALVEFADLTAALGGDVVGVNPLHALFPDRPENASPYSPSSRLFLNPLYIDPLREAQAMGFDGLGNARMTDTGPTADLVDYPAMMALKMPMFEALFAAFEKNGSPQRDIFQRFVDAGGAPLQRFATFQVLSEQMPRTAWQQWESKLQDPNTPAVASFAEKHRNRVRFHCYLQWIADQQLGMAAARCAAARMATGLYRDLAVGASPDGADTWAMPDVLARDVRFGAPPDAFNPNGQDWGIPPMNPVTLRCQAYKPFVDLLRANMRHAGALRIDHAMALMRLFWIPQGADAKSGAYVRYPTEEMFAVLALESQRNKCAIIGEDLGTVPDAYREKADRESVLSYRVLYFERWPDGLFKRPDAYPEKAVATATTHDLPTIAGHWKGRDIALRHSLGMIPPEETLKKIATDRRGERAALVGALEDQGLLSRPVNLDGEGDAEEMREVILAIQKFLARSPARMMLVNLDDLAEELETLNLPGTVDEYPNWRRRIKATLSALQNSSFAHKIAEAMKEEGR